MTDQCAMSWKTLLRPRILSGDLLATPMSRCLSTFDLTVIGIGHMIGTGIFVLSGVIAATVAGPAIIVSFLIAGFAAMLSALCYAEFGSRIPQTGSAYLFTYVMLGELPAFIAGWCVISENMIGAATSARTLSSTFDSFLNHRVENWTIATLGPIKVTGLSAFPDFIALVPLCLILTFVLSGAKMTAIFNNTLTILQVGGLAFIIILGFVKADISNWVDTEKGGFLPFGIGGAFSGAASCFFSYVGFDTIALAGEEALTPQWSIPAAILISMTLVSTLYILTSSVMTLMVPFSAIDLRSPFPAAFAAVGFPWASYIVGGVIFVALTTTHLMMVYAMSRTVYAMSHDGLIPKCLSYIHPRTQTPVTGTAFFGGLVAILTLFIDTQVLIELYSIGSLVSFTFVAMAILKIHYSVPENGGIWTFNRRKKNENVVNLSDRAPLVPLNTNDENAGTLRSFALKIPGMKRFAPGFNITCLIVTLLLCQTTFCVLMSVGYHTHTLRSPWILSAMGVLLLSVLISFTLLCLHNMNNHSSGFRVPLSPFLPALSMFINLILMFLLAPVTWARLAAWLAIGFVIYFSYGVRHSVEGSRRDED